MSRSERKSRKGSLHLSAEQQLVWRALLEVATRGIDQVDQHLQQRSNVSLTDYEILMALAQAEESRLRMSELAEQVFVSRSRLTYRVDRLTEVGFVVREECEDDRRGLWAIITESGRATIEAATGEHHRDLHQLIFDHMSRAEMSALAEALTNIAAKIDPR